MHRTTPRFWRCYDALPDATRAAADRSYELLKTNSSHPSLHLKKVGKFWSVRATASHRALGVEAESGIVWFWIGSHADYERLIDAR